MNNTILDAEEQFHDGWANTIDIDTVMVDAYFESPLAAENRYIVERLDMENTRGLKVLELGAGAGEASVYFAKKGSIVTATDLSEGMLDVIQKVALKHKTTLTTVRCSADSLPFPDETFDVVYAANLLHHVDIDKTLRETRRVLKAGGNFVAIEPLAHNPIINLYRLMSPSLRTKDEHPLKMKDIKIFKNVFETVEYHTTWLFTNIIFVKMFLVEHINPNKERYWTRLFAKKELYERLFKAIEPLDAFTLRILPFMKRYCRYITFYCYKKT